MRINVRGSVGIDHVHDERTITELQRVFNGFSQSRSNRRRNSESIHDNLNAVPDVTGQLRGIRQSHDLTVHAGPCISLPDHVIEQIAVFALLPANNRAKDQHMRPGRQLENPRDDLLPCLRADRLTAARAVLSSRPGEQHTEIIMDLRDRPDRASGIPSA